jgi:ankyrin repeat protein
MANSNNNASNASPKNGANNGTQRKPKKRSAAAQARRTAKWQAKQAARLMNAAVKKADKERKQQAVLNMFPNVMGVVGAQGFMPNVLGARATSKTMRNALGPGSLFNNAHRATVYPTGQSLLSHSINTDDWARAMNTLQKGVPKRVLNTPNFSGNPPLKKAFDANQLELFAALLEKGANPNFEVGGGYAGFTEEPFLHYVIKFNVSEAGVQPYVWQLILHDVDINKRDSRESTPLDVAIRYRNTIIPKLLIQEGAKLEEPNSYGNTPVLTAIQTNKKAIFDEMVKKGIDIDKQTGPRILFPLKAAVISGSQEILEAVLALNPKTINTKDAEGNTPLHYAVMTNALAKIALLKSAGANPMIANKAGETPRGLAQEKVDFGNARAYNLLKE